MGAAHIGGKGGSDRPFAHRRYLDAAALGETGLLCGDRDLLARAAALIRDGISVQLPNGVNPEKGGYDSHYQALGLVFACRCYTLVADERLRAEMRPSLERAFGWLLTRIRDDGSIDPTGNTRTGLGQEVARSGKAKGIEYRHVVRSLVAWSYITGDARLADTAHPVFTADRRQKAAP